MAGQPNAAPDWWKHFANARALREFGFDVTPLDLEADLVPVWLIQRAGVAERALKRAAHVLCEKGVFPTVSLDP